MIYLSLLTNWTMRSTWKITRLDKHLQSLRIESMKSLDKKAGKRRWLMNGMLLKLKKLP